VLGAQNAQIWMASVVIGIEPTPTQNGGSARRPPASPVTQRDSGFDLATCANGAGRDNG
jgi:hypothetical protein